jgi:hypothetical protein
VTGRSRPQRLKSVAISTSKRGDGFIAAALVLLSRRSGAAAAGPRRSVVDPGISGALLVGVDAIVWAAARDTPATDEHQARRTGLL